MNLLEFGSPANVILKAICDFSTPNKSYKKGEIVLNLQNIYMTPNNLSKNKTAASGFVDLAYSKYSLDTIILSNVPLKEDVYNLFSSGVKATYEIIKNEQAYAMNGRVLLTTTDTIDNVQVVGMSEESFTHELINNINVISSNHFVDGQCYSVYYTAIVEAKSFSINSELTNIPYFSLQAEVEGNTDKKDSKVLLLVDKVHIMYSPAFDFRNQGVSYCQFTLQVIDSEKKPVMVIYE